jgi:hypothetical protein
MVSISASGDFNRIEKWLAKLSTGSMYKNLDSFAREGVQALASATPVDSGVSAASWDYEIQYTHGGVVIWWTNSHVDAQGTPIVIMLQTGHGTGTGGYVQGRDFINPAIQPIFDQIQQRVFKEVTS